MADKKLKFNKVKSLIEETNEIYLDQINDNGSKSIEAERKLAKMRFKMDMLSVDLKVKGISDEDKESIINNLKELREEMNKKTKDLIEIKINLQTRSEKINNLEKSIKENPKVANQYDEILIVKLGRKFNTQNSEKEKLINEKEKLVENKEKLESFQTEINSNDELRDKMGEMASENKKLVIKDKYITDLLLSKSASEKDGIYEKENYTKAVNLSKFVEKFKDNDSKKVEVEAAKKEIDGIKQILGIELEFDSMLKTETEIDSIKSDISKISREIVTGIQGKNKNLFNKEFVEEMGSVKNLKTMIKSHGKNINRKDKQIEQKYIDSLTTMKAIDNIKEKVSNREEEIEQEEEQNLKEELGLIKTKKTGFFANIKAWFSKKFKKEEEKEEEKEEINLEFSEKPAVSEEDFKNSMKYQVIRDFIDIDIKKELEIAEKEAKEISEDKNQER